MFMPFETAFSIWSVVVPKYEWEPAAPPADPACGAQPELERQASGMPSPMQLVFKGMQWHTYSTTYLRENGAWQLCSDDRRDQDEERVRERKKPPSLENGPVSDTPLAPEAAPAGGLQAERNWP